MAIAESERFPPGTWQRTTPVTSTIIDAGTVARLDEALAAAALELPAEIAAELDLTFRSTTAGG